MNTIIDASTLPDLIHILIKDEDTFKKMKKDFPSILADLTSLKTTPNCSCRVKIGSFFTEKISINQEILDKDSVIKEIEEIKKKRLENVISGKTFKVPVGDEEWKKFSTLIQGKSFRAFSISREYDYLWVYFL